MKEQKEKRRSLIASIMRMSVIPILILGIILTIYSQNSVREGMIYEIRQNLSGISHTLISMYNIIDAGEFTEENGNVIKGETDLTSDYRLLDDIKNDTGADVTIFIGDKRCLTTLVDKEGKRLVGTTADAKVVEVVLGEGKEYFSEDIDVGGVQYFGYYVPIRDDDDEVIGISFAGKSAEAVNLSMGFMIEGNVIICIFVILLAGFICNLSAQRIVQAIHKVKEFLSKLAHGDFSGEMSEEVLERRDELSEMGEHAMTVSESLENMVTRDPLTGLFNRRAAILKMEKRAEQSHQEPYLMLMGDIDFFKEVNDNYGHASGDDVLKYVADELTKMVNEGGFVARWGGEEFLIGFQGTLSEMNYRLEQFNRKLAEKVFEMEEKTFSITMTFGVCEWEENMDYSEAIRKADDLLYYGKAHGRNQVVTRMEEVD